jgi:protein-S-isoprenylcysteine O-methyltransferase Ste14
MGDLLNALEIEGRFARRIAAIAIWLGFGLATPALAAGTAALEFRLQTSPLGTVGIVAAVWIAWTGWHSVVFVRHRRKYLETCAFAYRRAFVFDLIPGLTVSFSQMLRPALNGQTLQPAVLRAMLPETWMSTGRMAVGVLICVGALLLFASAWRALGAARVGFVPEFVETDQFVPVRTGPYAQVRHPLFWSGIFASCGLAVAVGTVTALAVALVNVVYGFFYNILEDRRLSLTFGDRYEAYARVTPRILPLRASTTSPRPAACRRRL